MPRVASPQTVSGAGAASESAVNRAPNLKVNLAELSGRSMSKAKVFRHEPDKVVYTRADSRDGSGRAKMKVRETCWWKSKGSDGANYTYKKSKIVYIQKENRGRLYGYLPIALLRALIKSPVVEWPERVSTHKPIAAGAA